MLNRLFYHFYIIVEHNQNNQFLNRSLHLRTSFEVLSLCAQLLQSGCTSIPWESGTGKIGSTILSKFGHFWWLTANLCPLTLLPHMHLQNPISTLEVWYFYNWLYFSVSKICAFSNFWVHVLSIFCVRRLHQVFW